MYDQDLRPATSYEQPQTERAIVGREEPQATLRQEYEKVPRTKQQILQEYPIGIRFLSKGCVVEVGCKTIAFSTIPEAMEAITTYVADPETVGEYWRGQFNM